MLNKMETSKKMIPTTNNDIFDINEFDFDYLFAAVDAQVDHIKQCIAERKRILEGIYISIFFLFRFLYFLPYFDYLEDLKAHVLLENRLVSDKLSHVQGLQRHLQKANITRRSYEDQEVLDGWSHGYVTRGELHRRYKSK